MTIPGECCFLEAEHSTGAEAGLGWSLRGPEGPLLHGGLRGVVGLG